MDDIADRTRFKAWKSAYPLNRPEINEPTIWLFILTYADHGPDAPDPFHKLVPKAIYGCGVGPWQGSKGGEVERLRPHYRALLAEQGWVVIASTLVGFKPAASSTKS